METSSGYVIYYFTFIPFKSTPPLPCYLYLSCLSLVSSPLITLILLLLILLQLQCHYRSSREKPLAVRCGSIESWPGVCAASSQPWLFASPRYIWLLRGLQVLELPAISTVLEAAEICEIRIIPCKSRDPGCPRIEQAIKRWSQVFASNWSGKLKNFILFNFFLVFVIFLLVSSLLFIYVFSVKK